MTPRYFLGPISGALAITLLVANGSVSFFMGMWAGLSLFLSLMTIGVARLSNRPYTASLASDGYLLLLGLPAVSLLSSMFQFRENFWIVLLSVSTFLIVTAPAWRAAAHHLRTRWKTKGPWKDMGGVLLVAIVLVAAFLKRADFIPRGLPYENYWDEPFAVGAGMRMLRDQTLNPRFFNYGSLLCYLHLFGAFISYSILKAQGAIQSTAEIITLWDTPYMWTISHSLFWYVARLLTVIYSCLGVLALFFVGKRLRGFWAGLFAMTLLALSPSHSHWSAWIIVDPLTTTHAILWAYAFLSAGLAGTVERKRIFYWATAFLAGVLVSTKVNTVPVMVPTLLLPLWDRGILFDKPRWIVVRDGVLISLVGFLLVTPYALFDFYSFKSSIATMFQFYSTHTNEGAAPVTLASRFSNDWRFLEQAIPWGSWALGLVAFLATLGMSWEYKRKNRRSPAPLLFLFPTLYFLFMIRMKVGWDRNLLVIIPFMALALSVVVGLTLEALGKRRAFLTPLGGSLLFLFLFQAPLRATFSHFKGFPMKGNESRTRVMAWVRDTYASQAAAGSLWIMQETKIHREDLGPDQDKFRYLSIREAWTKRKAGEKPLLLITTDLNEFPEDVMTTNQKLISTGRVVKTEGVQPVEAKRYEDEPKVYVVQY